MSSDLDSDTGIITQALTKKDNPKKKKSKSKPTAVVAPVQVQSQSQHHGKNEGDDPNWAYEPPEGAVLLEHGVDAGEFEWESIKEDEDVEIWLIRVPDSIKAKHLEGLEIDLPSSSRTSRVGSLTRKNTTYDVWSLGDDSDETDIAGGEELRGLSCLLPRKKKRGKLCIAPKSVSRHIVISAQPSIPTAPEQQPIVYQNPPRPSYGKELLTHSFEPYGARSKQTKLDGLAMDIDEEETSMKPTDQAGSPKEKHEKLKESKSKKRKVEGDSPKKSKKHKGND